MLKINNLSFEYFNNPVFSNVDLSILPGQIMHIKGANGAGKSTLIKCIAGLLQPTFGEISYQGQSILTNRRSYQQHLCYIGHKLGINLNLTPKENIFYNFFTKASEDQISYALEILNLQDVANISCMQLSMGQKKRSSLLRLFLNKSSIWLLDEPFVGLDSETFVCLSQLIANHVETGGMVIASSHQKLDFSANIYCEYTL